MSPPDDPRPLERDPPPAWAVRTAADAAALAAGCYWDEVAAERVVGFIRKYVSPKFVTGAMQLFEWQERWLRGLYGWRHPDGTRRFKRAVLHVAKKNGKTLLMACVAAYELLAAGVESPIVASFSTSKKNAAQIFKHLRAAIRKNKRLRTACRVYKGQSSQRVEFDRRDGEYHAFSRDAANAEGENLSCSIVDEAHAHRSSALYDTIEYAMLARPDGLQILISTAGNDLTHWYYGIVEKCRRILAGDDLDQQVYAHVYEASADDDVDDPATWRKANPSLDEYPAFTSAAFRRDLDAARPDAGRWMVFLRYRLNIFCRPEQGVWVHVDKWDQCKGHVPDELLRAGQLYVGADLSAAVDPSSLSAVWLLPDKRYVVRSWAWVAEYGVRQREQTNLPKYAQFAAAGVMTVSSGGMIDKALIRAKLDELHRDYTVRGVAMDITGGHVFGNELERDGYTGVVRIPQSFRGFNLATKEMAAAVNGRRLVHDGNPWLRWCVSCVRLDVTGQGEVRPYRKKSADHIDGAVAAIMGFRLAHEATAAAPPQPSGVKRRGGLLLV